MEGEVSKQSLERYRHSVGFGDDTDYLEVEGKWCVRVSKSGERFGTIIPASAARNYCSEGLLVRMNDEQAIR